MANKEHLTLLRQGVQKWNPWRDSNPNIIPDLIGANLSAADLIGANLSGLDLSGFDLSETNLTGANLSRTQALGTNFTAAIFTGICLEDWNINSATKLDDIDCQYVYLKADQKERRPSSGKFIRDTLAVRK